VGRKKNFILPYISSVNDQTVSLPLACAGRRLTVTKIKNNIANDFFIINLFLINLCILIFHLIFYKVKLILKKLPDPGVGNGEWGNRGCFLKINLSSLLSALYSLLTANC